MSIHEQLRNRFWPYGPRPNIWAIFDCARDPRMFYRITHSGLLHECLFAGDLAPDLQHAAPYLVQLECDDRRSDELIDFSFGTAQGVFIDADIGIKSLRKHLRSILRVEAPGGKRMLFRYYDPRVLRVYLPTCNSGELDLVFGPIQRFWVEEGPASGGILLFERKQGHLHTLAFGALAPVGVPTVRE